MCGGNHRYALRSSGLLNLDGSKRNQPPPLEKIIGGPGVTREKRQLWQLTYSTMIHFLIALSFPTIASGICSQKEGRQPWGMGASPPLNFSRWKVHHAAPVSVSSAAVCGLAQ
jgi:hypothetical protein